MDRLKSAGSSAMDFAKKNPIKTFVGAATFVVIVLALVLSASLRKIDLSKITDSETNKKVQRAQKSAKGLMVMAIILIIFYAVGKHQNKF